MLLIDGYWAHDLNYERSEGKHPKTVELCYTKNLYHRPDFIVDDFSSFCSIDSNTKTICGAKVTIGVAYVWEIKRKKNNFSYRLDCGCQYIWVNSKIKKIENMMWGILLKELTTKGMLNINERTLIVVDSDKDELLKFNSGQIFSTDCEFNLLPQNFKFAYTSAERGGGVFHFIIKACDTIASFILNELENNGNYKCADEIKRAFEQIDTDSRVFKFFEENKNNRDKRS